MFINICMYMHPKPEDKKVCIGFGKRKVPLICRSHVWRNTELHKATSRPKRDAPCFPPSSHDYPIPTSKNRQLFCTSARSRCKYLAMRRSSIWLRPCFCLAGWWSPWGRRPNGWSADDFWHLPQMKWCTPRNLGLVIDLFMGGKKH